MFWSTEASVSCNNLSMVATYEHVDTTSCPTRLQLIGGGRKPGELDRCSPHSPRPTMPKDPRAGVASPRAPLLGISMSTPRLTKSHSKPPVSSLSCGSAPSTSTQVAPYDGPSAPSIIRADSSRASDVGPSNAGDSATARSPTLAADNATKDGRAVDR
jgi:hypothetical protein